MVKSNNYSSSDSSDLEFRIDNNPFSVNNNKVVIEPSETHPLKQKQNEYLERTCTRSVKFNKICKEIIIDNDVNATSSSKSDDTNSEFSELTYTGNSCNCRSVNVFLESIEFTEGASGSISYSGNLETKPDLSKSDFSVRIPCNVSAFIVKVTVCMGDSNVKAHWWIDLKVRTALPLSLVKNGKNPCLNGCYKNTSATVVACNSHVMPCHFNKNKSNLYYTLTDKDTYVSPYNIYLFSSNVY